MVGTCTIPYVLLGVTVPKKDEHNHLSYISEGMKLIISLILLLDLVVHSQMNSSCKYCIKGYMKWHLRQVSEELYFDRALFVSHPGIPSEQYLSTISLFSPFLWKKSICKARKERGLWRLLKRDWNCGIFSS